MKIFFKSRRKFLLVAAFAIAVLGIIVVTVPAFKFEARLRGLLQKAQILPAPLPVYFTPVAPADRVSGRRLLVESLSEAVAKQKYEQAAEYNAILSQESFQYAYQALKAWETTRSANGLVPYAVSFGYSYWNAKDTASDLFSHLLIGAKYLDEKNASLWLQTLNTERDLCGKLSCRIDLKTGQVVKEDLDTLIFGTAEYGKDGLLPIIERFGRGPWFERIIEGTDAILDQAYVQTQRGLLPSNGTEVNGDMLQVLTRLYWATKEERYLQMAERIADTYLFDVFPKNNGFPADYWDFSQQKPIKEDARYRPGIELEGNYTPFRLVDHGGEIIPGLAELYFLEKTLGRSKAAEYRQPLKNFLDMLLVTGRSKDGLWFNSVDIATGTPLDTNIVDTWGYILNAYQTFQLAEGVNDLYTSEIIRAMRSAASKHSFIWELDRQDQYSDTIESMLYMLPFFDIPECRDWVDDEMEVLLLKQQRSGFGEGWYLDGNFVRTSLLYGFYKTQGARLEPWQENVRLGAALDKNNGMLYLHLAAEENWQGRLKLDAPRHRLVWNMPIEVPRLNELPEWYVVEAEKSYAVTNLDTGKVQIVSGKVLADGLEIGLDPAQQNILNLSIKEQTTLQ